MNNGKIKESIQLYNAVFSTPGGEVGVTVVAPNQSPAVATEYGERYMRALDWKEGTFAWLRTESVSHVDVIV